MNTLRRFNPSTQQRANGSPLAWLVLALIFFSATVQAQLTNGGPALDLSNGSVTVLHAADLNAFPITITAWFRTQAPVPFGGIIGKDHDTTFDGYAIALEGGQIRATYGGAAGSSQSVGAVDVDGQWHHFAFVVDASGSRLYVDGALRGSEGWLGTPGPTTTSYALSFGYSDRAGGFRGQIDEVAIWNVAQSRGAIQTNMFRRLAGNEAGLISYHPFDEGTGTTVADATGRGHTGTLFTGFTWINVPPSVAGTALRCTTNGAVTVPHNAALNAYPLTVSAWFREMPGMTGYRTIVSKQGRDIYHDQNESGYFLGLTPNFGGQGLEANFVPFRPDGQFHGVFLVDNTPVRDGVWHHAAFTVDSTGGKLYVDGVLRQSESWTGIQGPATTLAPFHIGYHPSEFEYYPFVGDVDEVSLWNTVLSGAAIRTNASRRLVGNESGLVAYYRLDNAAGTNVTDNTGHGYNGVIGSEAIWIASGVPNVQTISGRISPPPPPTLVHATVFVLPEPQAPIAIPDNGIVYATNVVSSVGAIGAVTVAVNLTHTFRGDIELTLIHPDGTEVRLKDPDVHDVAQDVVTTYPSPTRSVGNLGVLNGKSMAGAWRLRVRDAFADDVGTLESWVLILGVPPALSDTAGAFTLSNLFLNTYIVTPTLEGFTFNPASATVIAGATNANFTVVSGSISGRVTALGTGVAGVSVRIGSSTALTDTDGNYRIQALLPGNHTVTASLAGHSFTPVQLTVPFGTTNANFAVSGYPVSGRVVDLRTNGVANILVSASGTALNARTTNDGTYLIAGVPSGDRTITPGSGLALFSPSNHTVTLGPTGATEVDFVLQSTPPTISDITNRVIAKGTSTGPIRFMVDDAETRPGRLQVAASANDTNLVPAGGLVPGGVGNDRTLTVTPPPDKAGTTVITVTVTDEAGLSASDSFTLRVNQDPLAGLGLALNFDGVNDQVTVRTNVFGNKGSFTVECWVSAPSNSGPRTLMSQVGGTNTFTISLDPAGIIRVSEMWVTGVPFPFGGWHHLAVVKESDDTHLYLDGVLQASYGRPVPFPAQTNRFDIGRGLTAIGLPVGYWLGGIDEVRVWETARSGEEIATYQNVRLTGAETNLSAVWRFDERSGATAFDSSRHGWHGEVTGPLRTLASIRFDRYRTAEDVGFADVLQAADLDGDQLTFRMISPPAGMVTVTDTNTGAFTYVPARNASGQDRFTFTASDGYAESEVSVVTIDITADPNPPFLAALANQSVAEDTRLGPVGFTVSDLEEAATNLTVSGQSDNETLIPNANITFSGTGADRSFFVLPATNQFGSTTLRIIVSDGTLRRTNSFTMTVTPVNDLPQITVLTNQLTRRGVAISQPFTISDVDNSLSDLTVVGAMGFANPPNLIASIVATGVSSNWIVTVTPTAGVSGQAPISVIVGDAPQSGGVAQFLLTVNDPPTIAAIPNQSTFRNLATRPIAITVNDVEGDAVTLSGSSSNPALVASGGFQFSGTGNNRTLIIKPESGQIGSTVITVTARDNFWSASQSFTLFIEEGLDYTYVDLPVPAGMESAQALDLNESGLVVGRGLFASFAGSRAVVWDVNSAQPTVRVLANVESDAVAVNSSGQVVGATNGAAVIYTNNTITVLGTGYALDINDAGMVVGVANFLNNTAFFYDGTRQTNFANVFTSSALYGAASLKLSSRGDVFGISPDNNSALLWQLNGDGSRTLRNLGSFGGGLNSGGFNNVGEVAFTSTPVGGPRAQLLYNHRNSVLVTNLASAFTNAFGNAAELITDLNDASEMVGGRFFPAGQAFLYSGGFVHKLQDLVSTDAFNPAHATALNRAGDICGYGFKPGSPGTRPFLLRRQWIVGRPQSPPFQAISSTGKAYAPPTVDALDGTDPHQPLAYLWSDVEQKLYFLRPITARVTWYTISDFQNTNPPPPIIRVARVVWPSDPQLHVAGAPVQVEPLHASSPYRAVERSYSTAGSSLELATKSLRADLPGYTVIRYVIAPEAALGSLPDANTRSNYFQVVRTVLPDDPLVLRDGQLATVGIAVSDPRGPAVSTNSPKSGWVVNALSFYDGVGADAAYNRATQTGPIIPVNRDAGGTGDDLLVAFYKLNPLTGALWPDLTARFNVQWPTNAEKLVIANPIGSGPLSASQYPEKRVYVQNDRSLPGFNPNEEHAFLAPSSAGEGVFALRNDLNSANTSSNFVLLKYRAPASGEWRMKLYQVVLRDAEHDFLFSGEAGKEIRAPDPLFSFPLCTGTNQTRAVSGRA